MTRRALIAGATGLIGSNLAEHLISKNWEVYGIASGDDALVLGLNES
jgi:nucleoside-diphosphate-sugar epimerase